MLPGFNPKSVKIFEIKSLALNREPDREIDNKIVQSIKKYYFAKPRKQNVLNIIKLICLKKKCKDKV